MRARGWLLVVAIALGAGGALPARAADDRAAVVVARDGDVELVASDQDTNLCLGITGAVALASQGCGDPADGLLSPPSAAIDGVRHLGVATPLAAASVEVRRAGRVVGRAATVAGEAYKGVAAGSVRFAIVRLARGTPPSALRVHLLDAVGALIAVLDAGDELVLASRRLRSGRVGSVRWALVEERTSALTPVAGDPAHETVSRCVKTSVRDGPGTFAAGTSGAAACTSGSPRDEERIDQDVDASREDGRCRPDFRLLSGVVRAPVRRVTVTLGDARRLRTATKALTAGGRRAYAIPIPSVAAVRTIALHAAAGPPRLLRPALAPLVMDCSVRPFGFLVSANALTLSADLPAVTPAGPVTAFGAAPRVRVADGPADTLCLALDDRPFDARGCDLVTPLPGSLLTVFDDAGDPRAFAAAVPAEVVMLRLSSADRKAVLDVPTVAAPGYAGRYAGHVRFAASALPAGVELARVEALDATGKDLLGPAAGGWTAYAEPSTADPPRRVAGRPGAPSLWQIRLRDGDRAQDCLRLTGGPPPRAATDCQVARLDVTVLLDAPCTTRRLTVAVAVRAGTRVRVDTGREPQRPLRLRAGAGLVTLGPKTGLRALTFARKGSARRIAFDAPSGSRQCGWRSAPLILPQ